MAVPALQDSMPEAQQRLLRVLCVAPAVAGTAFLDWNRSVDWREHFDRGSFRLLPAVYKRIESLDLDEPSLGRLRGLFRRSWYRNQRFMRGWSQLQLVLAPAGVDVLLAGASAIAAGYRQPVGARHLERTELLVRPSQAAQALGLMREAGWHIAAQWPVDPHRFTGVQFVDAHGDPGRLRWGPASGAERRMLDSCWTGVLPSTADGCPIAVPAPAALLIDLLAGMPEQDPWTIAELLEDLRCVLAHPVFDWAQALELACGHGFAGHLRVALDCLRSGFGVAVPDQVLTRLGAEPVGLCERLELHLYRERQRAGESVFTPACLALARYLRHVRGMGTVEAVAALPGFLRQHYGAKSLLQVAMRLLRNGARRSVRSLGRRLGTLRRPRNLTQAGR